MGNQDRRLREYRNARNDGFKLAVSAIAESNLDDETRNAALSVLHKESRYREKLGIDTNLTMKELEIAFEPMRGFLNEAHILIWLSVLHDEFDFGKKRLNQAMDRFEQIYEAIDDGFAGYSDYVDMLNKKMQRILKAEYLVQDDHWERKEDK